MSRSRGARVLRSTLLRFAVASLLPILALDWFVSGQVTHAMKGRTATVYGEMTNAIFTMASDIVVQPADLEHGYQPERAQVLDQLITRLGGTDSTVRVRIVRTDGAVVYANHRSDMGTHVRSTAAFRQAAAGTVGSKFGRGSLTSGASSSADLIELYLPVRFKGQTAVSGVIVASGLDRNVVPAINRDVRRMQLSLALGLALLWLCLLPISASVSRRLRRTARENEHLALHDTLTGLANRNLFSDRLSQAIAATGRTGGEVGVLLIDLDGFKDVNDTLGHGQGDELLKAVGDRLARGLRSCDTVARLGGDEFAVVVPSLGGELGLESVVERLAEELSAPVNLDGIEVAVEASVGGSIYPLHANDGEELVRHADIAMYEAKGRREAFVIYSPDIDLHSPSRLSLAAELRRALETDDELVLYYQPVASADTGAIQSVEALVRWQHPNRGLIPPYEFIPMAEQSGLIRKLTSRVLDQAVRQARAWMDEGIDISVSVNLSASDLRCMRLLDEVESVLARHQLPGNRLELEVTETAVLANPDTAVALVEAIRRLGVRIALDDFGTGYSSLTYLKRLKPDRLKIDRSFVDAMVRESTDVEIVRSVIDLAHSLSIGVTAEGVETREHWDLLVSLACDLVQGYYLARPLPVESATSWLREHTTSKATA